MIYLAHRGSDAFEAARASVDIVCAGDSITGWNNFRKHDDDWPFCSYPEFLQRLCDARGLTVADCGIAGEISPNGPGQVRDYLVLFPNSRYFVLGYGGNDLDRWPEVGQTSPRIIENLDAMVGVVRDAGRTAVLLELTNADEPRLAPEEVRALRHAQPFHNESLARYCLDRDVPLVRLWGTLRAGHFDDPFHPNAEGAMVIADAVFRVLEGLEGTSARRGPAS